MRDNSKTVKTLKKKHELSDCKKKNVKYMLKRAKQK